ncbi:MAG: NAD(P)H-hydrate epimerase [Candidatus Nanohaloarchaeota archaeon QJJ-5]|nr:NAD(P)H-hydrate epimerase [Candidatus Nanohaloarchaeota archaeon QJJ-5]
METVTTDQMAEIDERVPEEYGITIGRLMENAAYQLAAFIRDEIETNEVTVFAGTGNNGGDALAAARRLSLWGYDIEVVLADRDLDGQRKEELMILEQLDVPIKTHEPEQTYDVALDGLIGYNLEGDPHHPFDTMIAAVNEHETIISIDVPTGVDADTGERASPAVEPDHTVTLAMPKQGLQEQTAGKIWVADISIPPAAYETFGFTGDIFTDRSLVRYRP